MNSEKDDDDSSISGESGSFSSGERDGASISTSNLPIRRPSQVNTFLEANSPDNHNVNDTNNNRPTNKATSAADDIDRPPTPWGDKCTDKKNIVAAMKDPTNDIHLYIGDYTESNFKNVNFKQLHKLYASRYPLSRFRVNCVAILKHKLKGTGPFKEQHSEAEIEPWKTRSSRSKGWNLLYGILMDPVTSRELTTLTLDELWNSNQHFKCYAKADFRKYLKDMKTLTEHTKAAVHADEELFQEDMKNFPPQETTQRGEKFWYNHPASSLLAEDLKNGWAYDMKPAQLRLSRKEYQDFTPRTFLKHVHQEKEKQRAAPYWRHKRNIAAQQKIAEERSVCQVV
jgi:hypothetical protein